MLDGPMVDVIPKSILDKDKNYFFLFPIMVGSPKYLLEPMVSETQR